MPRHAFLYHRRMRCEVVIMAVAVLWACSAFGQSSSPTLETIFAKQQERVDTVKSLTLTATQELDRVLFPREGISKMADGTPLSPPIAPKETDTVQYWIKGPRVKTDLLHSTSLETAPERRIHAYNGERYQSFYPETETRILTVDKAPNDDMVAFFGPEVPFAAPHGFAYHREELTTGPQAYDLLKQPERWQALKQSARIVGTESINGDDCVVVEIPNTNDPSLKRVVYFSQSWDLFPVRWEEYKTQGTETRLAYSTESSDLRHITGKNGEDIVVNGGTKSIVWADGKENWVYDWRVDWESVALNPDIPDSEFTISPSQANLYYDKNDRSHTFKRKTSPDIAHDLARVINSEAPTEPVQALAPQTNPKGQDATVAGLPPSAPKASGNFWSTPIYVAILAIVVGLTLAVLASRFRKT